MIRFLSNSLIIHKVLANRSAPFWSGACVFIPNGAADQEMPELVKKLIKILIKTLEFQ